MAKINTNATPTKLLELYFTDYMKDKHPRLIRIDGVNKYLTFHEGKEEFVVGLTKHISEPYALMPVCADGKCYKKPFNLTKDLDVLIHSDTRCILFSSSAQVYTWVIRYSEGEIVYPFRFSSYKGYTFTPHFEEETKTWWGQIDNIQDCITFEANSYRNMGKEFVACVNDYIKFCKEKGIEPDKPEV